MKGRVLAIDHGTVRLGFAISDPDRKIASPLATWTRKTLQADLDYLRKLIDEEQVDSVVIGLPLHLDGRESPSSEAARAFGERVQKELDIDCHFYDERFSSVIAEKELWQAGLTHKRRKDRRDRVAAQLFLQAYLEAGCPQDGEPGGLD